MKFGILALGASGRTGGWEGWASKVTAAAPLARVTQGFCFCNVRHRGRNASHWPSWANHACRPTQPVGKLGLDILAPVTWGLGFIKGRPGGPGGDSRPGPVLRPSHGLARVHVRAGARVSGVQFRILRVSI